MAFWFGGRRDDEDEGGGWGGILMIILAPIAAGLIQMAISRSREFSADEASAKYTGSPDGLINALRKLERGVQAVPMDANQATAHLFIVNPFSGTMWGSTHPSTEQRIARLEAMRFASVQ
jgi:heat shock protein HtpX